MGIYRVALLKNGTVVRTIEIRALPKAPISEETPSTATGGEIGTTAFWVVVLLAIITLILFWMRRRKKEAGKAGPVK
jgi:LPXTG-motif cell wall-anchored protein